MLTSTDIQRDAHDMFRNRTCIVSGVWSRDSSRWEQFRSQGVKERKEHLDFQMGWAGSGAAGVWVAVGLFCSIAVVITASESLRDIAILEKMGH